MSDQPTRNASPQPSRRQFLGTSAALAGTAMTGSLPLSRSAHAAGSDEIKIGLIGCGGRGSGAVASAIEVNPAAKLTAMADAFADRARKARAALSGKLNDQAAVDDDHVFDGFDAYRRLLDSGVDMAILGEAPHFRPIHLEACVEAGVHVFAEKPMAVDAPGVRRVLAAGEKAREKNVSFVSGFETRDSTAAREAIKRVHDGAIGEIVAIQGTYNVGPLWHRGHEPDWTEMEFQMRNWYYFTWLSGDHIVEQHVHFYDVAAWLMKEQPPLHAWGYGGRQSRTDPKFGDIFDHHAVNYEYPGGQRVYGFTRQQAGCSNEVSYLALGTKGRLTHQAGVWRITDLAGQVQSTIPKDTTHPESNTFRDMFHGIQSGQPVNDSHQMAHSTMLAILGRMATHSGQQITWDEALASRRILAPERYTWDADPPVLPGEDGKYPVPIPGVTEVL